MGEKVRQAADQRLSASLKARNWRAFVALKKEILRIVHWLADLAGFEPPSGQFKKAFDPSEEISTI